MTWAALRCAAVRAMAVLGRRSAALASDLVTPDERPGISGLTPDELTAWLAERGEPAYRARQIADAVWRGGAPRPRPTSGRCRPPLRDGARRRRSASTRSPTPRCATADGGLTEKALHRLADGALIESVLMHYPAAARIARAAHAVHLEPGRLRGRLPVLRDRRARLRARPRGGRDRRPGPLRRRAGWPRDGQRLTNIVFMGMGEPLLNLDRVLAAVEALNDPAPVRAGRPAHHGLDVRGRARDPAPDRARAAVHAGGLAPRRARPAARRAGAAQPALAGRRGRRRRPRSRRGDRPADHATRSR